MRNGAIETAARAPDLREQHEREDVVKDGGGADQAAGRRVELARLKQQLRREAEARRRERRAGGEPRAHARAPPERERAELPTRERARARPAGACELL